MKNPFPHSDNNRRFYTYDYYLRKRFGKKCFKVPLDGGFSCPNIDGKRAHGGCTYCNLSSREREILPISIQFELTVSALSKKWPDALHIAYLQNFSNTYAPVERLRELYYESLALPDVVGLSIATRADCLEDDVCELLYEIGKKTYLTVELGLQSSSDATAERINRGHSWAEFLQGYEKLRGLNVCVHIINGLPGESREDMIKTARDVALLHPHEIKIHLLHVLKNTVMAEEYERGEFETLTLDEYADIVVSQLELLPPDTVIGRVTGDGLSDELIAPLWSTRKFNVMNTIDKLMAERDTYQGKLYNLSI
ncbi:MAG: TIGR01212 family radical SAM protein [Clostridia bacterium]|nr:TIGR01212 family radical SAM protein [Clostridia bacterium]